MNVVIRDCFAIGRRGSSFGEERSSLMEDLPVEYGRDTIPRIKTSSSLDRGKCNFMFCSYVSNQGLTCIQIMNFKPCKGFWYLFDLTTSPQVTSNPHLII